jgi:hypothetical protein
MRYKLKRQATTGDIARLSFLILCACVMLWAATAFVMYRPEAFMFTSILLLEQMAIVGIFALRGSIFDFTNAPQEPKGWVASTFLERK